jgi:hypothetical protein
MDIVEEFKQETNIAVLAVYAVLTVQDLFPTTFDFDGG